MFHKGERTASTPTILTVFGLLALAFTAASAQEVDPDRLRVNINAEYTNDYGDPVEGVKITLFAEDDVTRRHEATVKADGTLRFENIKPGSYLVQMQLDDYRFIRSGEGGDFRVTVRNDGSLDPPNFRHVVRPVVGKGMWREVLIFFGIAAAGGAALI